LNIPIKSPYYQECLGVLVKRDEEMLLNNIELDMKIRLIESNLTQTEVAEKVGVSLACVNRITKGREQIVNITFVKMMDKFSYDVELT
jgi:Trp operon repressor